MSKERSERGHPVAAAAPAAPAAPEVATSPSLAGKVAVVTGGSSGIGRAIALAFAEAGAAVAITYRANRRGAEETLERLRASDPRAEAVPADLAEPNALDALAAAVRRTWGRVDVWVNNAGADILTGEGARLSAADQLDRLLAVDLRGTGLASWKAV